MAAEYTPRSLTVYGGPVIVATALGVGGVVLAVPEGQRAAWHWLVLPAVSLGLAGVLGGLCRRAARGTVGAADLVTYVRAGAVAVVVAWACFTALDVLAPTSWWLCLLATAALVLDGIDGAVARAQGRPTAAGARLDAETDAVMTLALSVVVAGQVGAWVVLTGALRYLFGLAVALRWGRGEREASLAPRRSRRVVAATSSSFLAAATAPALAGAPAGLLAGAALLSLVVSFAGDVVALERDLRSRVVGQVVGGSSLQSGVDASHVLAQHSEAEQLNRSDRGNDHHR